MLQQPQIRLWSLLKYLSFVLDVLYSFTCLRATCTVCAFTCPNALRAFLTFTCFCTQQHVPSLVPYPTWCFTCFTYFQIPRVLSALWPPSFFLCVLCSLYVSSALLGLLINLPHALCVLWVLTTHSVLRTFLICQFYLNFFLDHSNFALQVQIHVAMALSGVESFRGCRFSSL